MRQFKEYNKGQEYNRDELSTNIIAWFEGSVHLEKLLNYIESMIGSRYTKEELGFRGAYIDYLKALIEDDSTIKCGDFYTEFKRDLINKLNNLPIISNE
jgi:hypothetical protein